MVIIRRVVLLLFLFILMVSVLLLLNITAPNPTGRRYSSEMPLTTGQGNANDIGLSGEMILAKDLNLPRNDLLDQLQCVCNPSYKIEPNECQFCLAYTQSVASYRRPDFVGTNFIAESKNSQNLLYTGREVDQINDYALAATEMNVPLWVYVRVDTFVHPNFFHAVESTGGGVVFYFTVPGYVDPIDQAARSGILLALVALAFLLLWKVVVRRGKSIVTIPADRPKPKQPRSPTPERSIANAEGFIRRAHDRAQRAIDEADSRDDIG